MPEPIHPRELTPSMCGREIAILDRALVKRARGTLVGYRIEVETELFAISAVRHRERIEIDLPFGTIRVDDRDRIEILIRTATIRSLDRLRGHKATVALVAPKYVHMHPGVAEAISWLTATAPDPVVLLDNPEGQ